MITPSLAVLRLPEIDLIVDTSYSNRSYSIA